MAERAESLPAGESRSRLAPVVPLKVERRPGRDTLSEVRDFAAAAYQGANRRAARAYSSVVEKTTSLASHMKHRLHAVRAEKPLQVVLLAGGAAFIVGVALRIWRYKHKRYA